MKTILLIEDNKEIQIIVRAALDQFQVTVVDTLAQANKMLQSETFSLIILDIELPDGDGLKFLATKQENSSVANTPVFVMTNKSDISNKIMAFSIGVDDFIGKPFDPLELNARINAKLKKHAALAQNQDLIKLGDVQISVSKQKVWHVTDTEKKSMDLTSLEFKVLLLLSTHPDRVYSRDAILSEVWGKEVNITDRTVDTHIAHLRKKMTATQVRIETVIGEGYRLNL